MRIVSFRRIFKDTAQKMEAMPKTPAPEAKKFISQVDANTFLIRVS